LLALSNASKRATLRVAMASLTDMRDLIFAALSFFAADASSADSARKRGCVRGNDGGGGSSFRLFAGDIRTIGMALGHELCTPRRSFSNPSTAARMCDRNRSSSPRDFQATSE
jgi:hypothetical protein